MSDTKVRVHTLAKELGVSSKAIIEKCALEGIEIKNHMHQLSAGLEATIREWFTSEAHKTSVEDGAAVDLDRARTRRAAKKKRAEDGSESIDVEVAATAVAEPPTPLAPPPVAPVRPAAEIVTPPGLAPPAPDAGPPPSAPVAAPPPVRPKEPPAAKPKEPAAPPRAAASVAPPAAPPPERAPAAGPQNVPKPAQLQGPKLIRMDRPEYIAAPRPAPRPGIGGYGTNQPPPPPTAGTGRRGRTGRSEGEEEGARRTGPGGARPAARHRANPRRTQSDSPTVVGEMLREWRDRDLIERRERLDHASGRGIMGLRADETQRGRAGEPGARQSTARKERVQLTEPIVIKAFCAATGIAFNHVFRKLQEMGTMAGMNQAIDGDTAALIALEHGVEVEIVKPRSALERLADEFAARPRPKLGPRPPVVTVLGHVDHGKTSLLDRIRKSNVAAGEAGGITQHIGAYQVSVEGRHVTFLDTPGHEAFTAMRARGAQVTDVVVLVVAADDGVMPQTVEAINHARAAKVPIVVALNKIDLPQADDQKVFGQLSEHQLVPQEWGGETDVIKTSATTGKGVDELLQHLATLTDLLELKADATVPASGTVIEAQRSDKHGIVARVLVQEGTLKPGSIIACGNAFGRVRALNDSRGRRIKEAGPSTPVELFGLSDVPAAGDKFFEVDSLATAEGVADEVSAERRAASQIKISKPTTLESVLATTAEGRVPDLNVIIKADVQGSVDVLKKALGDLPSSEVKLNILHAGVGNVTESDIALAEASDAIIVGFHVVPDPTIQRAADDRGVEIRTYRIIYELSDDIRKALEGLLEPTEKVESRGRAEVREVFNITKVGRVAGCMVRDGIIARSHLVRVLRDGVPIKDKASLASLKRFKDDAREVRAGLECGLRIDGFDDVKPGDVIEAYEVTKVSRRL